MNVRFCRRMILPFLTTCLLLVPFRVKAGFANGPTVEVFKTQKGASEGSESIKWVCVIDKKTAWIASRSRILRSTDGWQSWDDVAQGNALGKKTVSIRAFSSPDSLHAWTATQDGSIFVTKDGGNEWQKLSGIKDCSEIVCLDSSLLVAMTERQLWLSSDAGESWSELKAMPIVGSVSAVSFTGNRVLVATGSPRFHISEDRGKTWRELEPRLEEADAASAWAGQIREIVKVSSTSAWAYGLRGKVFRTEDMGQTWKDVSPEETAKSKKIFCCWGFVDESSAFLFTADRTLATIDGGKHWKESSGPFRTDRGNPLACAFLDRLQGLVVGTKESIAKTADGGKTWNSVSIRSDLQSMEDEEKGLRSNAPSGSSSIIISVEDEATSKKVGKVRVNVAAIRYSPSQRLFAMYTWSQQSEDEALNFRQLSDGEYNIWADKVPEGFSRPARVKVALSEKEEKKITLRLKRDKQGTREVP